MKIRKMQVWMKIVVEHLKSKEISVGDMDITEKAREVLDEIDTEINKQHVRKVLGPTRKADL